MSSPAAFKSLGKNLAIISVVGLSSLLIVKDYVKSKKESKFTPSASVSDEKKQINSGYYDDLAHVKPGFPLPKSDEDDVKPQRKSVYQGTGNSHRSRKRGDRLGFLDRADKGE